MSVRPKVEGFLGSLGSWGLESDSSQTGVAHKLIHGIVQASVPQPLRLSPGGMEGREQGQGHTRPRGLLIVVASLVAEHGL